MPIISETVRVKVRFSEVDPIRMVWHGNYIKYLEDAREAFGHRYGISYLQISGHGYYAPVYDLQVRFLKPATVDDTLLVTITWKPAEGAKLCFDYEIRNEKDKELVLRASTVQLFTTSEGGFDPVGPAFFQEWKDKMLSE